MEIVSSTSPKRFLLRFRSEPFLYLTIFAIVALLAVFVAFPLFRVMTYPKLSHYQEYFTRSRWIRATFNSLTMAVLSTISITFCAFIYAYGMVRTNVPFKRLLETVAILPILSPPFVVAISYIMLFGGRGLVTHKLLGMNVNIYG